MLVLTIENFVFSQVAGIGMTNYIHVVLLVSSFIVHLKNHFNVSFYQGKQNYLPTLVPFPDKIKLKPEDQWSCKCSPDYFPGITPTVKQEKGATSIF